MIKKQKASLLDIKDKKIILELEKNSRISNKALAKKVGLSIDVVRYRINRFEKKGIIGWHLTFINFSKLGYTDYGLFISTQHLSKEKEQILTKYLQNNTNISYLAKVGGVYDYIIGILCKDVFTFNKIMTELKQNIGEFIRNKDIATRISLVHFPKKFLLPNQKQYKLPSFGGRIENIILDDLDKKILKKLSLNARLPNTEISKSLNVPLSTISFRIKSLIKKGIIEGFFTFFHPESYGYQNFNLLLNFKNLSEKNEKKLIAYCSEQKNIVYAIKCIGKWDYEISVEIKDQTEFQELLSELNDKFNESIKALEFVTIFKNIKYDLFPFNIIQNS